MHLVAHVHLYYVFLVSTRYCKGGWNYSITSYSMPNHSFRVFSTFVFMAGVILFLILLYTNMIAAPSSKTPNSL